jgi:hypothetical protein
MEISSLMRRLFAAIASSKSDIAEMASPCPVRREASMADLAPLESRPGSSASQLIICVSSRIMQDHPIP